ncbi:hypothetical protein GCM10011351_00650 [Paraliobacillus quinghaiensis]|uniref:ATP-grasp domain-containing protein n=1 Tax=Paraliobacillus quinghaiensis TaxID=470815 RepID=A0A917TCR4_9BACI|nr:YheC/YheD family protein [Paraliobacillus quinghaiensis]GGM18710.1 hypothetical protein GCM10011351_00650 [Paraliobacillus quinghaiensis]
MYYHTFKRAGASIPEAHFDQARQYFNKWEMYKLLAPYDFPFKLPYTSDLTRQSLEQFTYMGTPFFVKPVNTWAGKKISLVSRVYNGFLVKQPNGSGHTFPTIEALWQNLAHKYNLSQTIIQMQAPLASYDSRAFDIRVHLQRNEEGNWSYAGDLIRIGGYNTIVSNLFTNAGGVVETSSILENLYPHYKVVMIQENLAESAFEIAKLLDTRFPFTDIGGDFGVDRNGDLWLIEVNTNDRNGRPSYDMFKKLTDKSIYKKMKAIDKRRHRIWKMKGMFFR